MQRIFVITGNKHKFEEIASYIPHARLLDIDVPEIQEIDPKIIIENKLHAASKYHEGDCIIEDTSLYIDALHGLPGPLIKWFLKSVGNIGLQKIAESFGDMSARAITWIGYKSSNGSIRYFDGEVKGSIVFPRGNNGFGWDAIFQPTGSLKTFAEMTLEEKSAYSMRKIAAEKLQEYIQKVPYYLPK